MFITLGAQAGIAPKVLMDLARHSDVNLTMGVYSHTLVQDRAEALEAIPDVVPGKKRESNRATGTYDRVPASAASAPQNDKQNAKRAPRSPQATAPPGIRTPDPLIKSQLLCQLS